jgi:hypothetical protein
MVPPVDAITVAFVTSCAALVSAAVGPLVSVFVASRQIRASLVSSNRERWAEALRDAIAEYVALVLSAAILHEARHADPLAELRDDPRLLQLVERVAQAKSRIDLMVNPSDPGQRELAEPVEQAYRLLIDGGGGSRKEVAGIVESITAAGRVVLKFEWARVKRGE